VARWWRARAAVRVTPSPDGRTATLANEGKTAFERGVLLVDLPGGEQRRIAVPALAPGTSTTVSIPPG